MMRALLTLAAAAIAADLAAAAALAQAAQSRSPAPTFAAKLDAPSQPPTPTTTARSARPSFRRSSNSANCNRRRPTCDPKLQAQFKRLDTNQDGQLSFPSSRGDRATSSANRRLASRSSSSSSTPTTTARSAPPSSARRDLAKFNKVDPTTTASITPAEEPARRGPQMIASA